MLCRLLPTMAVAQPLLRIRHPRSRLRVRAPARWLNVLDMPTVLMIAVTQGNVPLLVPSLKMRIRMESATSRGNVAPLARTRVARVVPGVAAANIAETRHCNSDKDLLVGFQDRFGTPWRCPRCAVHFNVLDR